MEIKVVENAKDIECDVLVVNKFEDELTSNPLVNKYAPETFKGKAGETFVIHTRGELPSMYVLAVGLGKEQDLNNTVIRENIAKAVKKCAELKAKTIALDIDAKFPFGVQSVIGAEIANYHFDKYKTKKEHRISELFISMVSDDVKVGEYLAEGMKLARNLANEPAAFANPAKLAEIAQGFEGVETTIYDEAQIREMGMGAYLAVAQGSVNPPKFIHIKYIPQNPKRRVAIVGKGLCFDSGGLDIKPAASMLNMKDDMSGSAAVLAVMKALPKFNPDVEVHCIIASTENMIGSKAFKPGDILKAKNNKTIEVDNTDAEGRLTLADALCYADELGVDEIIDIATLTGACMVALGSAASGIMGNNDELINSLIECGKAEGENFWQLPMFEDYKESLKSDIADMKNTGSRYGGASTAGCFLSNFVKNSKWAHIDIAGTAYLEKPQHEYIKGATGVGVRTLLNYILK